MLDNILSVCYNSHRQNDESVHDDTQKTPELQSLGFFYPVLGRWFMPKADYQLFISIQPFANIIGDYTCRNRDIK